MKSTLQQAASTIFGLLVAIITIYIAHVIVVPQQESFNPTKTCTNPPTDCWDGYNKPFYKCITYEKDTFIRPGVIIKAGDKNCYKSVYFNLDPTALYMFIWLLIWSTLTTRAFELMFFKQLTGNLRKSPALAIILQIPSIWYVCSVMIHYLNDRYFPMYYSQLFFTFSEIYSMVVLMLHLSKDEKVYKNLVIFMVSVSIFHVIELGMDEPFFVSKNLNASIRNLMFLAGDLSIVYAGKILLRPSAKDVRYLIFKLGL
jgi:phage shock protein PspC (stress-responsive transcriptional regulator)